MRRKRLSKILKILNEYYGPALVAYFRAGIFTMEDINEMYKGDKYHHLFEYIK